MPLRSPLRGGAACRPGRGCGAHFVTVSGCLYGLSVECVDRSRARPRGTARATTRWQTTQGPGAAGEKKFKHETHDFCLENGAPLAHLPPRCMLHRRVRTRHSIRVHAGANLCDSDDPAKMADTKTDFVSRVPVAAVRCADALYTRARTRTHTRVLCNAHVLCRPLLSAGAS